MFSGLPRQSGMRVTGEASTALTTSSGGIVGVQTVIILVRWIITSETASSRRSSRPPNMSRSMLLDAAFAVQQVDRAAQLLVRRQHRLVLADCHAEQRSSQRTSASIADQHRAEQLTNHVHRPRHQRARCGRAR